MYRTLEEYAERVNGKGPGLLARAFRFKVLMIGSVLGIGTLLTVIMGLD